MFSIPEEITGISPIIQYTSDYLSKLKFIILYIHIYKLSNLWRQLNVHIFGIYEIFRCLKILFTLTKMGKRENCNKISKNRKSSNGGKDLPSQGYKGGVGSLCLYEKLPMLTTTLSSTVNPYFPNIPLVLFTVSRCTFK